MCERDGKPMEHFLIHCLTAKELWSLFLLLFEVPWVFPSSVVELFLLERDKSGEGRLGVWQLRHYYGPFGRNVKGLLKALRPSFFFILGFSPFCIVDSQAV